MRNERTFIMLRLITVFLFNCCVKKQQKQNSKPALKLAVAYDLSGSTKKHNTPALTTDQVDSLISLIEERGGELALTPIHSFSYQPLIRLELEQVSGRLDERARLNQKNKNELSSFRYSVYDILKQPRASTKNGFIWGCHAHNALF